MEFHGVLSNAVRLFPYAVIPSDSVLCGRSFEKWVKVLVQFDKCVISVSPPITFLGRLKGFDSILTTL